ncbi:MAG TPA: winged helix-turn-helix domain-containing protein, partial [Thermoanaerobaculia bacterium]
MSVERFPGPRTPSREPARDFRIVDHLVRPSLNRVSTPTQTVTLEPKVMRVLARLAAQPGAVVTKEELFRDVWDGAYVTEDVLTRAIGELRRLFG